MKSLTKRLTQITIILGLSFMNPVTEAQASESDRFFCAIFNGQPTTMIKTSQGDKPLIQYSTTMFGSSWTSQAHCQEVTKKLNVAYGNNEDFLTVSREQDYLNIICSAKTANGACQRQILTVPNGKSAADYLNALRNRFYGRTSGVLFSRPSIYAEYNGIPYWNIGEVIRYWESVQ